MTVCSFSLQEAHVDVLTYYEWLSGSSVILEQILLYIFKIFHGCGGGLVTKSCPTLVAPWTVAHHAPLSMGFSRQEYWSGLPFPSPGNLLDAGMKPVSSVLQVDSLPLSYLSSV